jgi:hypothetical protein
MFPHTLDSLPDFWQGAEFDWRYVFEPKAPTVPAIDKFFSAEEWTDEFLRGWLVPEQSCHFLVRENEMASVVRHVAENYFRNL